MKTEAKLFLFMVIFFAIVVTPAYAIMTWDAAVGHPEVIGTTVLVLTLAVLRHGLGPALA
jgi:hypothetical protein